MPPQTRGPNPDRYWGWFLGMALALGLLRFFRLGEWSLWIDEALTLNDARDILAGAARPQNPLGYWAAGWTVRLLGDERELALRLSSAVAGWLAIPLTYWAFRPFAGRRRAALAALLLAASTWQLYWSQNARFYTLAQDLALASGALFARGLFAMPGRSRPLGAWSLVAGFALGAAAALAHPSALILIGALVVAPAFAFWCGARPSDPFARRALLLIFAGVVGIVVALAWAGPLWQAYNKIKGGPSTLHYALTTGWYVTPWLGAAAIWGALAAWKSRKGFDLWIVLVAALTLAGGVFLSLFALVAAQYVFVALPWIALAATLPLERMRLRASLWQPVIVGLLLLPSLIDQAAYFFLRYGDRERWREAYQYVWNQRGRDDLILGMSGPVGEYYLSPESRNLRRPQMLVPLAEESLFVPRQWARRDRRLWLIVQDEVLESWPEEKRDEFRELLATQCTQMVRFSVPHPVRDLSLVVYVLDPRTQ